MFKVGQVVLKVEQVVFKAEQVVFKVEQVVFKAEHGVFKVEHVVYALPQKKVDTSCVWLCTPGRKQWIRVVCDCVAAINTI